MNQTFHDEISMVAFELYQKEGCPEGRHLFHWSAAEKIVKERYKSGPREPADRVRPTGRKVAKELSPDLYTIIVQMR